MKTGEKIRKTVAAAAVSALAATVYAVAWPGNFWTQVENGIAETAPSGSQLGEASNGAAFSSCAYSEDKGDAFGSAEEPFDTVRCMNAFTAAVLIDASAPTGLFIYIR